MRVPSALALLAASAAAFALRAEAHHSYAMFDGTRTLQVTGTIAKLEWRNPHVYVWMYVPDPRAAGSYTLYSFENGSTNVLMSRGWSKNTFAPGQQVTVVYWPLRDGRPGGHFVSATLADGRVVQGAGGPRGIDGRLPPGSRE